MIEDVLKTLLEGLVENTDAIKIAMVENEKEVKINIDVDKKDIGRVIGKDGKIAKALSVLVNSMAYKNTPRKKYFIKVNEGKR